MIRFRNLLILYVGFLYYIGNVFSHDLDLSNFKNSGFSVRYTQENQCTFTEITPNLDRNITRVLNGSTLLWNYENKESCVGVVLITNPESQDSLMYMELLSTTQYKVRYFSKTNDVFTEINKGYYDQKLKELKKLTSKTTHDNDESSNEQRLENDGSSLESELWKTDDSLDDLNNEFTISFDKHERKETLEDVLEEPSTSDGEEEMGRRSSNLTSRRDSRRSNSRESDSSDPRRVFDIANAENDWLEIEYDSHSGLPTMTAFVKNNKKVTQVHENERVIWDSKGKSDLVVLAAYAFYAEFRLVFIVYAINDDTYSRFYQKFADEWVELDDDEFTRALKELKSHYKSTRQEVRLRKAPQITLNLANVEDNGKFFERYKKLGKYELYVYIPLNEYTLNKVIDGNIKVWKSGERKCVTAVAVKEGDSVRFLRLDLVKPDRKKSYRFYMKEGNEYVKVEEDDFYTLVEAGIEKPDESETESSSWVEVTHQCSPEFGCYKQVEVELELDSASTRVEKNQLENVVYRTFTPDKDQVFKAVLLNGNEVWRSKNRTFCDFVRVFYPNSEPKMLFLREAVNGLPESKDIYLVENNGNWNKVDLPEFKRIFKSMASQDSSGNQDSSSQDSENDSSHTSENVAGSSEVVDPDPFESNIPFSYPDHTASFSELSFYYRRRL